MKKVFINKQIQKIVREWCADIKNGMQQGYSPSDDDKLMLSMFGKTKLDILQVNQFIYRALCHINQQDQMPVEIVEHPQYKQLLNEAKVVLGFFNIPENAQPPYMLFIQ